MKQTKLFKYSIAAFAMTVLMITSCEKNTHELPQERTPDYSPQTIVEFRSGQALNPDRFLGKGFNLIRNRISEEAGISTYSVVDYNRLQGSRPWDPIGNRDFSDVYAPEIISDAQNSDPVRTYSEDISNRWFQDSLGIDLGSKYKKSSLNYKYANQTEGSYKSHVYRSYIYKTEKKVFYDAIDPSHFSFFLHARFINDLKRMRGYELVNKYGTHLITSYLLGPFIDLTILAKESYFTKNEIATLSSALFDKAVEINGGFSKKLKENYSHTSVIYRQGGSDYAPEKSILTFTSLFNTGKIETINENEWYKQIRKNDNTFMSLSFVREELVPIHDLIPDVPLKIKYICGIIDAIKKNTSPSTSAATTFVFCEPKTFTPVLYNGEYIHTKLLSFETQSYTTVFYGNGSFHPLSEYTFTGKEEAGEPWIPSLNENGLWTLQNNSSKRFLCYDLVMRSELEDTQGKRFWMLNPILPSVYGGDYTWSNMLIKKN